MNIFFEKAYIDYQLVKVIKLTFWAVCCQSQESQFLNEKPDLSGFFVY